MFKHVVMWKLKNKNDAQKIKIDLESLHYLDCVKKIEVGFDISRGDSAYDLVLYSEFEDEINFKK